MKKLEIEETKATKYSTFKTYRIKVGLVFSISNFFITKTSLANKWMRKKIPSCSNSALVENFKCLQASARVSIIKLYVAIVIFNLLEYFLVFYMKYDCIFQNS